METALPKPENPPFQWFGGKWKQAERHIIPMFPEHHTFLDAFGGGGSLTLLKPPAPIEILNDLDGAVANFWRCVRQCPTALAEMIAATPHSRTEFRSAVREIERMRDEWATTDQHARLELARQFAVLARQSMATAIGKSWSTCVTHSRRSMASCCSRWINMPEDVRTAGERLKQTIIECEPAINAMERYDRPYKRENGKLIAGTLHYLDPPYPDDVRAGGMYRVEMGVRDHLPLLETAKKMQGAVVISSYPNNLYDKWLGEDGWEKHEYEVDAPTSVASTGAKGGGTRTEVLWSNPVAVAER